MDFLHLIIHLISIILDAFIKIEQVAAYRKDGGVVICFINSKREYIITAVDLGGRVVLAHFLKTRGAAEHLGDRVKIPRGKTAAVYIPTQAEGGEVVVLAEPKEIKVKMSRGGCPHDF